MQLYFYASAKKTWSWVWLRNHGDQQLEVLLLTTAEVFISRPKFIIDIALQHIPGYTQTINFFFYQYSNALESDENIWYRTTIVKRNNMEAGSWSNSANYDRSTINIPYIFVYQLHPFWCRKLARKGRCGWYTATEK